MDINCEAAEHGASPGESGASASSTNSYGTGLRGLIGEEGVVEREWQSVAAGFRHGMTAPRDSNDDCKSRAAAGEYSASRDPNPLNTTP